MLIICFVVAIAIDAAKRNKGDTTKAIELQALHRAAYTELEKDSPREQVLAILKQAQLLIDKLPVTIAGLNDSIDQLCRLLEEVTSDKEQLLLKIQHLELQVEAAQKSAKEAFEKAEAAEKKAEMAETEAAAAKTEAAAAKTEAASVKEELATSERVHEQQAVLGQLAQLTRDKVDEYFGFERPARDFPSFSEVAELATERLRTGHLKEAAAQKHPQLEDLLARFPQQTDAPAAFTALAKVIRFRNVTVHAIGGEDLLDWLDQCKSAQAFSECFDDLIAHSAKKALATKKRSKPLNPLTRDDIIQIYQLAVLLGVEGTH